MTSFDDLDAPQYSTFDDFDQEKPEQYFEIDHESERLVNENYVETEPQEPSIEENFYSPMIKNSPSPSTSGNMLELRSRKIRRSSSCGDIQIPTKNLAKMCLNGDKPATKALPKEKDKFQYGKLTKENARSQTKLKWCSQESLTRLAAPKKIHSSTGNLAHASQEYVSVAEAVRKFHEKTPNRYHSQNKNQPAPKNAMSIRLKATIPMSPHLLTKKRVKMNEHIMSHEERLQVEFEKEQKFKIKAHPVNKRILQPMKAVHVEKKPATVPAPFNLTKAETKKTVSSPKKEDYQFHAKPMPKSIVAPPKLPKKVEQKMTVPLTPTFIKKQPKASPVKKPVEKSSTVPLRNTKPEPFSFEKRDMKLMKKKEELIKKVVEEEKKAREFHARPIPKPVATMINKQKQKSHGSACSLNQSDKSKGEHEEHFKARPATVLHQKPFEPKKSDQPLIEIQPFNFNSEMRAKERERFEQKKREQEELAAKLLKEEEEERLRREEEEVRRIREETKFKAHPIRNFKGVVIQPSTKITEPISPIFLSGKSKKNNKENELQH